LFAGLLDISRFDAGVVEVKIVDFELAPLIERICRDHSEEARARGLVLRSIRSSAITRSDPLLVERVIRNFITNAIRYTDRGGIVVGVRRRGIDYVVQVWDSGPGIAEQDQTRIFDEFVQIGNTERDRAKGLGLGLAIVRRLSTLLSAPLGLRSWPGRGSCFEIRLPKAEAAAIPHVEREESIVGGALARGLIVVIDDEEPIREAMEKLLSGWGYEVMGAASGNEAIAKLALCPTRPSLIISDYRLRQQENGIEVVERLRGEYNEQIAALLVTGDTAPERLRDAAQSGLTLLHKPVRNNRLRAAITNAMRGYTRMPTEDDHIRPA
jgi:CheY-like chemotaxis protein/anti-sigma regulatory factor (Ser/Thr protein kinase)